MGVRPETSFEMEWRLWRKGERVAFKAYPELKGIVGEEARLYPFVLWPGEERAHAIHASEILLCESGSEQPASLLSKEGPPGESSHAVLYRGENDGLFMAAEASFTQAHELSLALTVATGKPHWVDPLDVFVRTEGSNRVYWKR